MQQTTASQSFQKSLTNEVWATFPPTQITLTAFLRTDVSFSAAFPSSIVWRREASLIVNFWPAVCHKLKMFGRGGSTQTFITRDSELGYMRERGKKKKKPKHSFSSSPAAHAQWETPPFLTPWRFSERAICLSVVTATISGPSCTSPLSCKWGRDPDQ